MNLRGKITELKTNDDGTVTLILDMRDKKEYTISKPKENESNTVVVDRDLLEETLHKLRAMVDAGAGGERLRKLMLAISCTLNKDE